MNRYLEAFLLTIGLFLTTGVVIGFAYIIALIREFSAILALVTFVAVVGTIFFFLFLNEM
ncbi:hypothetical protein ESZ50_11095 [Weissella muntiaci]|uniref:Uncharacterized protein n=1 Tax=Weissella muntiaci TaxID=2508881 RepID=A0A6C2C2V3_9LACO|nr:hypothetical protein [Weissella muntiaci]TYC47826.1 hypothetical protein ESZ50_11095 [Weissella muntiaci]